MVDYCQFHMVQPTAQMLILFVFLIHLCYQNKSDVVCINVDFWLFAVGLFAASLNILKLNYVSEVRIHFSYKN